MTLSDLNEQLGTLDLLLILLRKGSMSKSEAATALGRSFTTAYSCLKLLRKLGLLSEVEAESFPYRKDVSLTERGRRVAEHLVEVEKILSEKG